MLDFIGEECLLHSDEITLICPSIDDDWLIDDFAEPGIDSGLGYDLPLGVSIGVGESKSGAGLDGSIDGFSSGVLISFEWFHEAIRDIELGADGMGLAGASFFEEFDDGTGWVGLDDLADGLFGIFSGSPENHLHVDVGVLA